MITLTVKIKVTLIYTVRDDTKKIEQLVLEIKVISLGMGGYIKGLYPAKCIPLTARLANDPSGTREQNGFGWGKCFKLYMFDKTH